MLDLADIDLRLKAAGEHKIISDFTFREMEKGYISVEFTTQEGVHMTIELGDINSESKIEGLQASASNYMGVRSYKLSIQESGKSFNMLEPPFLNNNKTVVAMNIREPDHSSLSEVTSGNIDNLTIEGIRFLFRKYNNLRPTYYQSINVASYDLPLSLIEAHVGLHEQAHAENPQVADFSALSALWESRKHTDRPRELLQSLNNVLFTTEDYANIESIAKFRQLTSGMKNQAQIMNNIGLMSGFAMRTYLRGFESMLDPALTLSKKDVIYGIKSSDVLRFAEKVDKGMSANSSLSWLGSTPFDDHREELIKGILHEKEEREKQKKPTWTSLARTLLSSCVKR